MVACEFGLTSANASSWPPTTQRPLEQRRTSGENHTTAFAASLRLLRAEDLQVALRRTPPISGETARHGLVQVLFIPSAIAAQARWPLGVHSFAATGRCSLVSPKASFPMTYKPFRCVSLGLRVSHYLYSVILGKACLAWA